MGAVAGLRYPSPEGEPSRMRVVDIGPGELMELRAGTVVLDIRTRPERDGDLGWIPGSRWVGESRADAAASAPRDGRLLVLACMSGRRSLETATVLAESGIRVANLKGGLLAWGGEGFPICRRPSPGDPPPSMVSLRKQLRSCFLVEAVRASDADDELADRALRVVEDLFPDDLAMERRLLEERVDQLAELAWRFGHPIEAIARNVERFYAMVGSLD